METMNAIDLLTVTATVLTAILLGSMTFFSLVMAPLIFIKLELKTAGQFVRAVFPWYYLAICLLAGLAGLLMLAVLPVNGAVLLLVAAAALYCRASLTPQINRYRDQSLAGDQRAGVIFNRLHRLSEVINVLQLLAVFGVLLHLSLFIELT